MKEFFKEVDCLLSCKYPPETIEESKSLLDAYYRVGVAISSSSHKAECTELLKNLTGVFWLPSDDIEASPYKEEILKIAENKTYQMFCGPNFAFVFFIADRV